MNFYVVWPHNLCRVELTKNVFCFGLVTLFCLFPLPKEYVFSFQRTESKDFLKDRTKQRNIFKKNSLAISFSIKKRNQRQYSI